MKRILFAFLLSLCFINANGQIVEPYGGGSTSDNAVMDKIDIKEIGRSIHVATVEEGKVIVRRFYRGKWEEFDQTPITGVFKLKALKLFAYRAVPYLFCYYDENLTVIRAIDDKWEFVGEEQFGEATVSNPEFSVIGETPYIVYEDKDYEMIRMFSLLDESWYDVDVMPSTDVKSYKLAANARGDLYMAVLDQEGVTFKDVDQMVADVTQWKDLTKKLKLEDAARIDDFEFIENKAYITYNNENGPVIMTLEDLGKKWEVIEDSKETIVVGTKDYNLNISEYYFYTFMGANSMPQYLKNNKRGVWSKVKNISDKKARAIASDGYRNIIYVAYVDNATQKLMVKTIEKGEIEDEEEEEEVIEDKKTDGKNKKGGKKK
jgi:hypothetical protein